MVDQHGTQGGWAVLGTQSHEREWHRILIATEFGRKRADRSWMHYKMFCGLQIEAIAVDSGRPNRGHSGVCGLLRDARLDARSARTAGRVAESRVRDRSGGGDSLAVTALATLTPTIPDQRRCFPDVSAYWSGIEANF